MPGYGVTPAYGPTGLLPWSWALERLTTSHEYWMATVSPDGRPHVMPVWAVWLDDGLWFSSANGSRKARNLRHDSRATLTTDDPHQPVIVEGAARPVPDLADIVRFAGVVDEKYETSYGADFYDPARNTVFALAPTWAFALRDEDFTGTPTRWTFPPRQ